jgi:hypothetical protein
MRIAALSFVTVIACGQSHWPAQLELDIKAESWDAAVRVGAALVGEIDGGRMFTRFADIPAEVRTRRYYADALEHTAALDQAREQRRIAWIVEENRESAPGYQRRLENLKASVLAEAVNEPSSLPPSSIVVFWAEWCALCKPELQALARFSDDRMKIVKIDVDHADSKWRRYVPMATLQSADLPQLYVTDRSGRIRFHIVGYEEDGFFLKRLQWMVDAALRR